MDMLKMQEVVALMPVDKISTLDYLLGVCDTAYLLGNGGSSAVCSHISQDYTKMFGKTAMTFDNTSQLSCYTNDFGQDSAYAVWLEHMTTVRHPLVILISSSGNSENIMNAACLARTRQMDLVILTGFEKDNRLRKEYGSYALVDYWVDSTDYGIVECAHQIFLHAIL